jgi:uncharacterized membrane protein YfhO
LANGKTFINETDPLVQHYPALMYYGRFLRSIFSNFLSGKFAVPLYDFNIGFGSDILTTLHYYVIGDPLTLLSFFVPLKYCAYLYNFLVILRLYFAGLAFSLYCFNVLPAKNRDLFSILTASLVYVFSGYSILFVAAPFFLNVLIYFPLILLGLEKVLKKEKTSLFTIMIFISLSSNFYTFYMISAMTFMYLIIRLVYQKQLLIDYKNLLFLLLKYLIGVFLAGIIFIPNLTALLNSARFETTRPVDLFYNFDIYKTAFFDFFTAPSNKLEILPYGLESAAFPLIALLATVFLFFRKNKFKELKFSFILLNIFALIPACGYALTGFSYVTNRWMFAYTFVVALITAVLFPVFAKKNTSKIILLALTIINIHFLFNNKKLNHEFFIDAKSAFERFSENELKAAKFLNDTSFWRVETPARRKERNRNIIMQTKGTDFYFSLSNPYIAHFYDEFEIYSRSADIVYQGLDSRTILENIANVTYFVTAENESNFLPYGYDKKVSHHKKFSIYKNDFALPFGFTYSSYIPLKTFKNLTSVQKEQSLIQGVVLEEKLSKDFNLLERIEFDDNTQHMKIVSIKSFNLEPIFEQNSSSEFYLRFQNLTCLSDYETDINLDNEHKKAIVLQSPKYIGSIGKNNYLVNINYLKSKKSSVDFKPTAKISLEKIELISFPLGQNYQNQISKLQKDHLKNFKIRTNSISANIELNENKILFLSIPYSKGWSAFINSKKTKLLKANIAFSAIALKAGSYEIALRYLTPGLKLGALLSLLGIILFCVIARKTQGATATSN